MSSILPGFEYDIFISYRQKDNKYDGWVNDFVVNLQKELQATFKEDISVYFDENQHDGLLENHVVDKSLEGKLKCLIFIPIISQTYCDPKSFAWQHEFKAFNKMANEDRLGRELKLSNGNFASRILPVKIHDLDPEDKTVLESELGGALRAIEFIYKSVGVNRSLKPNDERTENLNHTYYRDQINKVANAIKEIIRGFNRPAGIPEEYISTHIKNSSNEKNKNVLEKCIAVLPFSDMSPAHDQEYLGDGMAEELLTILSQVKELKVTGRTSSFSFKNKNVDLKTIGNALNVESILEGSIQKAGNRIRITAQLINAADGYHIWGQRYDREMNDIFELQDDICSKIAEHLKLTLLKNHTTMVEKRPTNNLQAYELFLKGDFYYKKYTSEGFEKAIEYFKKALELDPSYAEAWWYLGLVNFEMHGWLYLQKERLETAIDCAKKAIAIDETSADAHFLVALIHFNKGNDWQKVESGIELGNKFTHTPFPLNFLPLEAWYRAMLFGDFDFAVTRLQMGVDHDPLNMYYKFHLAQLYLYGVRDYKKTISILNDILDLGFPQSTVWRPMCLSYLFDEKYTLAEEYARKDYVATEGKGHGAANLIMCLAVSGKNKEAQHLYQSIKETLPVSQFPELLHVKANTFLGNKDEAFEYLDRAINEKNYWLFTLKYSPEWDLLRSDPRFEKVLERMNYPK